MQAHPRTLRLPCRTAPPSHSSALRRRPKRVAITVLARRMPDTARSLLHAMPVAHAPQCSGVKLFRLAGGRGSFATVRSLSGAFIIAVAVGAASPVGVRAQGGAGARAPAV